MARIDSVGVPHEINWGGHWNHSRSYGLLCGTESGCHWSHSRHISYSAALSLEAAETTAALRAGPETTDVLLSIEASARRIKIICLCWSPRDASVVL